ncbi:MAG: SDR family oxidoreductase [Planctomycetes bacterium]|nr:SDR family oxidoreductase [Planctomycetota bacterium]
MSALVPDPRATPILVTGASGYIGGRLVPRLLDAGYEVRCFVREPRKLASRPWAKRPGVEIVVGDLDRPADVRAALRGCSAAFYLVHSMIVAGAEYARRDRELAEVFAHAAAEERVGRIVYLGGLGETGENLSAHLASRRDVESVLASTGVPVTVLRAAMIIGAGSASFEILRYLVERLPVMVTPRWVETRCQPIAVADVLHYLVACLAEPRTIGQTLDIGGPEVLSYRELMQTMAEARGLGKRRILSVPILTPRLSSLWIHLVTPISSRVARPLAEGLRNEVVCRDDRASQWMPRSLATVRAAIEQSLANLRSGDVETAWTDSGPIPGDPDWAGGSVFVDRWQVDVNASAEHVFAAVCRLGGKQGWHAADFLWRLRGSMDRWVGGPGLRRGRRDPEHVAFGDALDFWRVTEVDEPRRLALRAEMRLPGEAQMTFELEERHDAPGTTRLTQTARFVPRGLGGLAYWYAVLPFHSIVFRGMLAGVRRQAEERGGASEPSTSPVRRLRG